MSVCTAQAELTSVCEVFPQFRKVELKNQPKLVFWDSSIFTVHILKQTQLK